MLSPQYSLREQAFMCLSGRFYVILDLARDKYFCIEKQQFDSIKHLIGARNRPTEIAADFKSSIVETSGHSSLVAELLQSGLLVESPKACKAGDSPLPRIAAEAFDRDGGRVSALRCITYLPAFIASAISANNSLRNMPLVQTVHRVAERKRQPRRDAKATSSSKTRRLVAAFDQLRPFYDRRYLCLFDSLALLDFLGSYGLFPMWVFGVQSEPFAAHCWVQEDGVLLNDTIERVNRYTPIMAV